MSLQENEIIKYELQTELLTLYLGAAQITRHSFPGHAKFHITLAESSWNINVTHLKEIFRKINMLGLKLL